ncbi:hypothetical protein MRB53_019375 [Persea americana]|uniref:Uncharacterized protein n=1 Tax=Persea americana TaxID=3435 RepID=A0ACC2KZ43_PERAE|nr:hypothetical protein MRB53_019375 [Persea americana]
MRRTSAKELWQKLEEKYMTKSLENRIYLKKKLFRFEYRQGIFMSEHLDDFNKIIADLMNIDVKIDDKDKALLLLNSLPNNYDHFTHTLINGKTEVQYDVVSATLMNNEYRKKDKQAHRDSSSNALTDESKASDKSKQVEFDVNPVKSDGDYTNEEETPVDIIPVELEGDGTDEEETPAQEPPQKQADSIAASRPKRNI